eukprot:TRINITY_DN184_c6_g1_i1.p1 TRINITY_DN184_c6_g1~~TRINITY_DN184_c6_g1_i1.p1  ORF type:complete len:166 (+),score=13.83 TRINITY_DN184_c6_g1_i1:60-557(+)
MPPLDIKRSSAGWAELENLLNKVIQKGLTACCDEVILELVIKAFFCLVNELPDTIVRYTRKMQHSKSPVDKLILLNIFTSVWLRCWGKKWVPLNHQRFDEIFRASLLPILDHATIRSGPECNIDEIDLVICNWHHTELIDDRYMTLLRKTLFNPPPAGYSNQGTK